MTCKPEHYAGWQSVEIATRCVREKHQAKLALYERMRAALVIDERGGKLCFLCGAWPLEAFRGTQGINWAAMPHEDGCLLAEADAIEKVKGR